jgi:hypothetical protein
MQWIFKLGAVGGRSPFNGTAGSIPVYKMNRDQVDRDRAAILRSYPHPPGTTITYPYIVKIAGEGEYVVNADGTAQFYNYRYGRWEPPQVIDNNSMWAKATGNDS